MAKPKGGNLAALWEVSDRERQEFFDHIQKRSLTTPETAADVSGYNLSSPDNLSPPDKLPPSIAVESKPHIIQSSAASVAAEPGDNLSSPAKLSSADNLSAPVTLLVDRDSAKIRAKTDIGT